MDIEIWKCTGLLLNVRWRFLRFQIIFRKKEETYSRTDQIRRSSRSVCTNISEGFRERRYQKPFIAKLVDAEGEGAETQVWLQFAEWCGYVSSSDSKRLSEEYNKILGKLVTMENQSEKWTVN